MQLPLDILLYRLTDQGEFRLFNCDGGTELVTVRLYTSDLADPVENCLWIVSPEELSNALQSTYSGGCLLCADPHADPKAIQESGCPAVILAAEVSVAVLMNRTMQVLHEMTEWERNSAVAILEQIGIQALIDLTDPLLGYPLIVFDANFKVLGASHAGKNDEALMRDALGLGYTAPETMLDLNRRKIMTQVLSSAEPIIDRRGCAEGYVNLLVKFTVGDTVVGHGGAFRCPENAPPGLMKLLDLIFNAVTRYFARADIESVMGPNMYDTFLSDLLAGPPEDPEKLRDRLQYIDGLDYDGPFVLMKLEIANADKLPLTYLSMDIARSIIRARPFIFRGSVYILRRIPEETCGEPFSREELEKLDMLIMGFDYRAGISYCFTEIDQIAMARNQCEKALEYGGVLTPKERLLYYRSFCLYHIMQLLSDQIPVKMIQSSEYRILDKYDAVHKTNLCELYAVYLLCGSNANRAAEQVYMHRNTLRYNIRKIETILGGPLERTEDRINFLISYYSVGRELLPHQDPP